MDFPRNYVSLPDCNMKSVAWYCDITLTWHMGTCGFLLWSSDANGLRSVVAIGLVWLPTDWEETNYSELRNQRDLLTFNLQLVIFITC